MKARAIEVRAFAFETKGLSRLCDLAYRHEGTTDEKLEVPSCLYATIIQFWVRCLLALHTQLGSYSNVPYLGYSSELKG